MSIASRGPVVLKEDVQVSRIVDGGGLGRHPNRVIFDQEIHWVRECEYNVALFHMNIPIKDSVTLGDGPGEFLCALDEGVYEAAGEAAFLKIPIGSDGLEVRLTVIVKDVPLLKREDPDFGDIEGLSWYDRIPPDWSRVVDGVSYPVERPDLEGVNVGLIAPGSFQEQVVDVVNVWSSTRSAQENSDSVEAFRAEYGLAAFFARSAA